MKVLMIPINILHVIIYFLFGRSYINALNHVKLVWLSIQNLYEIFWHNRNFLDKLNERLESNESEILSLKDEVKWLKTELTTRNFENDFKDFIADIHHLKRELDLGENSKIENRIEKLKADIESLKKEFTSFQSNLLKSDTIKNIDSLSPTKLEPSTSNLVVTINPIKYDVLPPRPPPPPPSPPPPPPPPPRPKAITIICQSPDTSNNEKDMEAGTSRDDKSSAYKLTPTELIRKKQELKAPRILEETKTKPLNPDVDRRSGLLKMIIQKRNIISPDSSMDLSNQSLDQSF